MSEEPQPSAKRRAAGNDRRGSVALRVLPDPNSPQGRAEALASAWARGADQPDWCIDANAALAAGCTSSDSGVTTIPASERRAVHLARQGMRARAILAADEPGLEQQRRERSRRLAVVIGSAVVHAVGFIVLATAVADLRPKQRSGPHEHLFETAVVPIEVPLASEPIEVEPPAEPPPIARSPKPTPPRQRSKSSKPADAQPSEQPSEQAKPSSEPYELHGFELSSEGTLPSGAGSHGTHAGSHHRSHAEQGPPKPAASKPDVQAKPRGGLLVPEYPPQLERKGIEGSVLVKVWIDEHGHVIKAEVVESSGEEAFDHNAVMAAQRQEWTPAIRNGEEVATTQRYRVHFRLR